MARERQPIGPAPSAAITGSSPLEDEASPVRFDPVLWIVLLVQAGLSLPGMAARTLWLDEAYSAVLARRSFAGIRAALRHDSGPPLYYDLLRIWRWVFGESPLALRAPSLLFALGCTLLLYRLAARRFDVATGRMAAALFAVLPLGVFYADEVRNYTLLAFVTLLLLSLLAEPGLSKLARLGGLGVVLVFTVYSHNVGWFVAAAALCAAALAYGRRVLTPWLALPLLAVLIAFLPWYPVFREQAANIDWVGRLWSPWSPFQSIAAVPPFGFVPVYLDLPSGPGAWWVAATALWLLPVGYAAVARVRRAQKDALFAVAFVALGLSLPAIASAVVKPMSLPGRHDFFLVPVTALLAAVGLGAMPALLRRGVLTLMLALGLWASISYARHAPPRDERAWTSALASSAARGDVVLCTSFTRPAAEYYLEGRGLHFASYPRQMAEDLAHLDEERYLSSVDLASDARVALDDAAARAGASRRVWVVATPRTLNQPLYDALAQHPLLSPEGPVESEAMGMRLLGEPVSVIPCRVGPRSP